jgi:hypothetical protein
MTPDASFSIHQILTDKRASDGARTMSCSLLSFSSTSPQFFKTSLLQILALRNLLVPETFHYLALEQSKEFNNLNFFT